MPQLAPWPIRIRQWQDEIEAAAEKRGVSPHAFLVKSIRRVLDGEKMKSE